MSPRKGRGLVSLLFGKVHSFFFFFFLIRLRFEETSTLLFFVFSGFTISPIFSCFTDFTARQIGHLCKSTFISPQFFFYSKCKGNTNNPIYNHGAGLHISISFYNRTTLYFAFISIGALTYTRRNDSAISPVLSET